MLPKPEGKYGYTDIQLTQICKDKRISRKAFDKAFGVNTIALDDSNGKREPNYYECDVKKALYILGDKDGDLKL